LRQDRIAAQVRAEAETAYAEEGFVILAERPAWRDTSRAALRHLQDSDGHEVTEAAVTDPTQWAVLLVEDTVLVDAVTAEPVDEGDIDWNTEHRPERQPAEGSRHADTVVDAPEERKRCDEWEASARLPSVRCPRLADFRSCIKPVISLATS
jgi:ParB family transcriptional regulator, chromosome partitioning protein